jgi:adenosylmethionine-8-amino-7-oxononanoate aminotransferase
MNIQEKDRLLLWHPFTQEKTSALPIVITKGKDSYLFDEKGNKYLDAISSWWVNIHGHSNKKIAEAIFSQAKELEHVLFAGFTHAPAVTLCEKLEKLLPKSLRRFFFSDNGSTAVEVALKMAFQYFWNQGERNRNVFLSFEGAYHGDTFGAMAVGKTSGYYAPFQNLFFQVQTLPYPATHDQDKDVEKKETAALTQAERILKTSHTSAVAFILEPLVQGASGMRMVRPTFLRSLIDMVRSYKIPIIFDEVMTGFYRTGSFFALNQLEREPDILCLSKGLTGGFLPLSLTITSEEIYNAFLGERFDTAFAHGHSYTANPLGCAAANASLELLCEPKTVAQINQIAAIHKERLPRIKGEHHRHLGTIAAWSHPESKQIASQALSQGILIRPLGNTIYLLPPYCISSDDLHHLYDVLDTLIV